MKSVATRNVEEEGVRILKVAHCPSLSGKSKLTYQIGSAGKDDVRVRVVGNSAAGAFNPDWVALDSIEEAFAKCPKDEPITAVVLDHLFRGKSMNSPYFIWAILKAEGLVRGSKDSPRGYERQDKREFVSRVHGLLSARQGTEGTSKAKKGKGEGATSKKTAPKSRT